MRDSYVYIDGRGNDKINHAYYFGGPRWQSRLSMNFALNIGISLPLIFWIRKSYRPSWWCRNRRKKPEYLY